MSSRLAACSPETVSGRAAFAGGAAGDVMSAILHADPAALHSVDLDRRRTPALHRIVWGNSSSAAWKRSRTGASTGMLDVTLELQGIARAHQKTDQSERLSRIGPGKCSHTCDHGRYVHLGTA
jgi:hypothetical protein